MIRAAVLNDVIGQPGPTRLLARLIARDRLPHALILAGLPGCGRRTLARAIAAALLCQARVAGDACGTCASCRLVAEDTHPDLVSLPHDTSGDELGVELVRSAVVEGAQQSPLLGTQRVFILPGAERLGLPAANALLKVLEEPPPGTYLVMTVASEAQLLKTIRSRAQLLRLQPLATADLERVLERGGLPPATARLRAPQGAGSHRGLWDDDEAAPPLAALLALAREGHRSALVGELAAALPQKAREDHGRTLAAEQRRVLGQWLRALSQALRADLRGPGAARAADLIERVQQAEQDLRRNLSPHLILDSLGLAARAG